MQACLTAQAIVANKGGVEPLLCSWCGCIKDFCRFNHAFAQGLDRIHGQTWIISPEPIRLHCVISCTPRLALDGDAVLNIVEDGAGSVAAYDVIRKRRCSVEALVPR